MRAVNLLPSDTYAPKPKLPYAPVVLAATAPVLAGALVYLGYSLEHSKVTDRQIAYLVVQSEVAAVSPSEALTSMVSQIETQRAQRQTELSDALNKQLPWDVTLEQVGRVLPANAWLTSFTAQSPTPVATTGGATAAAATIQGYTHTLPDVAHVLARLALVPTLTDVELTSAAESKIGAKNVIQFTIGATISWSAP